MMITDDLLAKYIKKETSGPETAEVEQWINTSGKNRKLISLLSDHFNLNQHLRYPDFESAKVNSWSVIQARIQEKENRKITFIRSGTGYRIAASIAFLVFASIFAFYLIRNFYSDKEFAATDKIEVIQLQDGSIITLNKNSRLVVDHGFQKEKRNVALSGEAYFEVAKDKEYPFVISTQNIETTVVGTAFNLSSGLTGIEIVVDEGVVKVEDIDSKKNVLLHPNEAAEYRYKKLSSYKNENLNVTSWKTGIIRFRDTPIEDALNFLSHHYGRSIKIEGSLQSLTLTVTLDNLSLDESLSVISETLSVKIENRNGGYYLQPEQ